jgi:transposase
MLTSPLDPRPQPPHQKTVLMAGIACLAFIGDKALDANRFRKYLAGRGIEAVIPMGKGTSGHPTHDAEKYKWRHLVENFFCDIKVFRRIATRSEKNRYMLRHHDQRRPLHATNRPRKLSRFDRSDAAGECR